MEIKCDVFGERIDTYLGSVTEYSRSKISKAIKDGCVLVNGEKISQEKTSFNKKPKDNLPVF